MKRKRILALGIAAIVFSTTTFGCANTQTGDNGSGQAGGSQQTGDSESGKAAGNSQQSATTGAAAIPEKGERLHGFTVQETGTIEPMNAQTATLTHDKSGLTVFLIGNEDPELSFEIAYRVPQVDETDVPHIFEHSIISGSKKYPSSDIMFDMMGKSYHTFLNAFTYQGMTVYPLASMSQDQLEKMMDVYMSCMEEPSVLEDKRIFEREALRYQLHDEKEPIEMMGTVFTEDNGYLTDVSEDARLAVQQNLYPGTVAANIEGQLHRNYKDLKYANLQKVFDKYYSYDNAIVVLYGDMDFDRELGFLDDNYLKDEEKEGKSALAEYDLAPAEGHHKAAIEVPAYEGDTVENHALIEYAVDLSDFTVEELLALDYFSFFANKDSSVFNRKLKGAGIYNAFGISNMSYEGNVRPMLQFWLDNANPDQEKLFYKTMKKSLKDVAKNGFSKSLVDNALKENSLGEALTLENTDIGVEETTRLVGYFMCTGKTDFYAIKQKLEKTIAADKDQKEMKRLAKKLLDVPATALITAVPKPGSAEQIEAEREAYLKDRKAGMSEEQTAQMVKDTKTFDQWNENPEQNSDFLIDPKDLPDPERLPEVTESKKSGITLMSAPADIEGVGDFSVYFDTSSLTKEDLYDLNFYLMSLTELPTKKHTYEELTEEMLGCLSGAGFSACYPGEADAKNHRPMVRASWLGRTSDIKESLGLALEILQETDFTDRGRLLEMLKKNQEDYNPATSDANSVSADLAASYLDEEEAYDSYLDGPGYYSYLKDIRKKLEEDEGYVKTLSERMEQIRDSIVGRTNLIFTISAQEDEISGVEEEAVAMLKKLPENPVADGVSYGLTPEAAKRVAVYVEAPSQCLAKIYSHEDDTAMKGRYYPFYVALNDRYIVPTLRFKLGVYSPDMSSSPHRNWTYISTYLDPNVGRSLVVCDESVEKLKNLTLTQDELDGYIANAYGSATTPYGVLTKGNLAITNHISEFDVAAYYDRVSDIRNATVTDQQAAAECLERADKNSITVMAGNKKKMEKDAGLFDVILDYQKLAAEP